MNDFVENYYSWMSSNLHKVNTNGVIELITPMLDRNNDAIPVLISNDGNGKYFLTDNRQIVSDLEFSGFKLDTDARFNKYEQIVNGFGLKHSDDLEIYVTADESNLYDRFNMLLQGLSSVDDLFCLNRDSVRNMFKEDVESWFLDNDIRFVEGADLQGKSGLSHKFDYAIGRSKSSPERLIRTVNNPSISKVESVFFGWNDVSQARGMDLGYVFLNTLNTSNQDVSKEVIDACMYYNMKPVLWGKDQNDFIAELAA